MALRIGTTGPIRYGRGSALTLSLSQLMSDPEKGMWQKRQRAHAARPGRTWTITLDPALGTEVEAILAEFEGAAGSAGEITFRPPGETGDITARFAQNSLSIRRRSQRDWSVSFQIIQDKYI